MFNVAVQLKRDGFKLDIQLNLPQQGISAIYGPSGSGKTTLLRCIAGFERCQGGIHFLDQTWLDSEKNIDLDAYKRPIGYVFQEGLLFEHLDVSGNIKFAQRRAMSPRRFDDDVIIDMLALGSLMNRNPSQLSGGERQRAALARTLMSQPQLLLLDEPLSAVDTGHKAELLPYLKNVCSELDIPALLVSHGVDEIAELANEVALLDNGQIMVTGATDDMLAHPLMQRLSGRLDAGRALSVESINYDEKYKILSLSVDGQVLKVPTTMPKSPGTPVRVYIRARDVSIAKEKPNQTSIRNALTCRIESISKHLETPFAEITLSLASQQLMARITRAAVDELALTVGDSVFALIKSVSFDQSDV